MVGSVSDGSRYLSLGTRKGTPGASGVTVPSASAGFPGAPPSTSAGRTSAVPVTVVDTDAKTGDPVQAIREAYEIFQAGKQIYDWVNSVSGAAVAATERYFPGSTAHTQKVWAQAHEDVRKRYAWGQKQSPAKSYRTTTVVSSSKRAVGRRWPVFYNRYRSAKWRLRGRRRSRRFSRRRRN